MNGSSNDKWQASVCLAGIVLAAAVLSSCMSVGVVKMSKNSARIVVEGSALHQAHEAQQAAFRQAAVTTIQCGYDGFIVLDAEADGRSAGDWGSTPVDAFTIRMFVAIEAPDDALLAREVLGERWQEIVKRERKPVPGC